VADQLGSLSRTHTCGALRDSDVGARVTLLGWVHRVRDLGGVVFIDVRDREGITQVVIGSGPLLDLKLRSEYVIGVIGTVRQRAADTVNPKLPTGTVEVAAEEIRVLNESKTPPFSVSDDSTVSEDVRLRYRYLDLRRPRLQYNMGLRHRVTMAVRKYIDSEGFREIHTPKLST
jgi:aspartyl-tRNA synthetase